jgi:hypothetical protein
VDTYWHIAGRHIVLKCCIVLYALYKFESAMS